jgi:hypothetical protein
MTTFNIVVAIVAVAAFALSVTSILLRREGGKRKVQVFARHGVVSDGDKSEGVLMLTVRNFGECCIRIECMEIRTPSALIPLACGVGEQLPAFLRPDESVTVEYPISRLVGDDKEVLVDFTDFQTVAIDVLGREHESVAYRIDQDYSTVVPAKTSTRFMGSYMAK